FLQVLGGDPVCQLQALLQHSTHSTAAEPTGCTEAVGGGTRQCSQEPQGALHRGEVLRVCLAARLPCCGPQSGMHTQDFWKERVEHLHAPSNHISVAQETCRQQIPSHLAVLEATQNNPTAGSVLKMAWLQVLV
ncbi:hypothetical protein P7K49_027746, partial [Saguinus oedipus]